LNAVYPKPHSKKNKSEDANECPGDPADEKTRQWNKKYREL
jgi:hypothetical protein